jgi:hypothetical protein
MTNGKRGRKPKYLHTIILDGINARELYKEYKQIKREDINIPLQQHYTPIIEYSSKTGEMSTQISDLTQKKQSTNIYLDLNKETKKITLIDYVNYGCMPERTDIWCFHCKHPFNTSPIGIPIKYITRRPDKEQEIGRIVGTNDYFLTYGIFCSFPCCLAFLKEHNSGQMFRNSKSLLYTLYYKLYGSELKTKAASSWECLKVFGGHLTIEEYRKNFCSCNYVITPNIKRPYMVSVGRYIEENRCGYI